MKLRDYQRKAMATILDGDRPKAHVAMPQGAGKARDIHGLPMPMWVRRQVRAGDHVRVCWGHRRHEPPVANWFINGKKVVPPEPRTWTSAWAPLIAVIITMWVVWAVLAWLGAPLGAAG